MRVGIVWEVARASVFWFKFPFVFWVTVFTVWSEVFWSAAKSIIKRTFWASAFTFNNKHTFSAGWEDFHTFDVVEEESDWAFTLFDDVVPCSAGDVAFFDAPSDWSSPDRVEWARFYSWFSTGASKVFVFVEWFSQLTDTEYVVVTNVTVVTWVEDSNWVYFSIARFYCASEYSRVAVPASGGWARSFVWGSV